MGLVYFWLFTWTMYSYRNLLDFLNFNLQQFQNVVFFPSDYNWERERETHTHTHTHTNKHHTSSCKHGHEKSWWVALFFICKIQVLSKWWSVALFSICNIQLLSSWWWVAIFLFTTFKDFPSKGWIAFPFVHKHSNTSHSKKAKSQEHMWERSNLICILDSSLNLNDISAIQ
jgi:hypothetical protein